MTKATVKIRFAKQYTTNPSGNVFRRYEADDGRMVEIRIRAGRHGRITHSNAEAKQAAVNLLTGRFTVVDLDRGEYGIYDNHHERFINRQLQLPRDDDEGSWGPWITTLRSEADKVCRQVALTVLEPARRTPRGGDALPDVA